MKNINRLQVFTKKILLSRLYIAMMSSILLLSVLYAALPAKSKSPDIKVGIYTVDEYLADNLISSLQETGTIYSFYKADSIEQLRRDVESGNSECGFYIPADFFTDYIEGTVDANQIILYQTAGTTLANAISESIFSHLFKFCAADILFVAYDNPQKNSELSQRLEYYINSEEIFRIEDHAGKRTVTDNIEIPINIPVYQASVLLIVFSGLLGLLMYIKDREKNYYIALNTGEQLSIKLCQVLAAIIPILLISTACCLISYKSMDKIYALLISALGVTLLAFFPGCFIKKSSSLVKLLPIIMLLLIPLVIFL